MLLVPGVCFSLQEFLVNTVGQELYRNHASHFVFSVVRLDASATSRLVITV